MVVRFEHEKCSSLQYLLSDLSSLRRECNMWSDDKVGYGAENL